MISEERGAIKAGYSIAAMPERVPPTKLGDLVKPAQLAVVELLEFEGLKADQWFMRLSFAGSPAGSPFGEDVGSWEPLAAETATNDAIIKERITQSSKPVTQLAIGYVGMIDWRGSKRLMAYLQYFRADHAHGVLCVRHIKETPRPERFEGFGELLIVGACKNIWV